MRSHLRQNVFIRQIRVRPRLFVSGAVGLLIASCLPEVWISLPVTRLLLGWNFGVCLYLLLSAVMIKNSTCAQMQDRACKEDDGQLVILALVILAALASVAAIIVELASVKAMQGASKYPHIALAVTTIVLSWAFTHMMFAMHYAHDFYLSLAKNVTGGLDFPGDPKPDYLDFCYLAFVIGTSGQTADVSFTSKPLRRVGLIHCVLAFLFNTTILALMINIAASLF
jgi:uncharacterized membrane protein